jgi:hypothetical protein
MFVKTVGGKCVVLRKDRQGVDAHKDGLCQYGAFLP